MSYELLKPVIALAGWSLVMLLWLYAARIPAMRKAGIDVKAMKGTTPGGLDAMVPGAAQWPAHNYMHLMEQPTVFYAVVIVLALTGQDHHVNVTLAWVYVGLRILHSLVQATFNRVIIRFLIFSLASIVLIMLTFHAAMALWQFDLH
jgi:hypothetical protein